MFDETKKERMFRYFVSSLHHLSLNSFTPSKTFLFQNLARITTRPTNHIFPNNAGGLFRVQRKQPFASRSFPPRFLSSLSFTSTMTILKTNSPLFLFLFNKDPQILLRRGGLPTDNKRNKIMDFGSFLEDSLAFLWGWE